MISVRRRKSAVFYAEITYYNTRYMTVKVMFLRKIYFFQF